MPFRRLSMGDESAKTFFSDVAAHTRFLVAVPLLIAGSRLHSPIREVARHFLAAGLIKEQNREHYSAAVASSQRLLSSVIAEIITVALAYGPIVAIIFYVASQPNSTLASGRDRLSLLLVRRMVGCSGKHPATHHSVPGLGMADPALDSTPLAIAHLDLNLKPYHPDRVGGLRL